jgi:outer membrane immunogenic protein
MAIAFAKDWNAFVEYRYTNYGSSTMTLPLSQIATTSKTDLSEIEFGVNYKFDLSAPGKTSSTLGTSSGGSRPAPLYKANPRAPEAYDWTGVYGGFDGSYGWAESSGILTDATGNPLDPYNLGVRRMFAGALVGGNYQFNHFVVGAEADFQWGNLTANSQADSSFTTPAGTLPGGPFTISTTLKEFDSVRGRLGYAFDRFLIYGTGGWAWGNATTGYALLGQPPFGVLGVSPGIFVNNADHSGWTAGAGLDYAFTKNVFGRIEYRHTDLGTTSFLSAPTNSGESGNKVTMNDIRVGIAYKFGPDSFLGKF